MKKLYFLFIALIAGSSAFGQTVANAGMETFRSGNAGSGPVIAIHAPSQWFGFDSLVIGIEEAYLPFVLTGYTPTDLHAQLWQENTIKHGGSSAAKLMTLKQDTIGFFAGILSNAKPNFDFTAFSTTMDINQSLTFSGGTAVTDRIATVSAWVQYSRGKDSTGAVGLDSGVLNVTVYADITGVSTLVGTGTVTIGPSTSFQQITANVTYTDSLHGADTVRILFSSSNQSDVSDSSTLYVDDITMAYVPDHVGVKSVNAASDVVKVYPNPASGMLYLEGKETAGAVFQLYSASGQLVATKTLSNKDAVDISALPEGLYMYTITDKGNTVQRGKVSVVR